MKILTIDTSAAACSIAIKVSGRVYSYHETVPMQQAATILPLIERLLGSANLSLEDLTAIAFGEGPGSFTGLRIAASVAKGLAFALQIPVIPVSSLLVLAQYQVMCSPNIQNILVAVDARMDEVYWAAFKVLSKQKIKTVEVEQLCLPEKLLIPKEGLWFGVGNAWHIYGVRIPFLPDKIEIDSNPRAEAMIILAEQALMRGEFVSALQALPVYLREKVTF